MTERFDSWQGFLDAGFVAEEDGSLCLGDATASFSATKDAGEVRVRFSADLPGCEDVEFNLPSAFDDMWEWAAEIASRTFGSRQTWDDIRKKLRGRMNPDLEQMISIGIDHLDEIEANVANAPDEDENSDIEDGATEDRTLDELEEDGAGCASNEDWSSCLREIVKEEMAGAWQKLSDAAQAQDMERSQTVMDRVNRLKTMDEKIAELAEEWKTLGLEVRIARGAAPAEPTEPTPTVLPETKPVPTAPPNPKPEPIVQPNPKPEPKGPMGFAVTFEDGVRIGEAKASVTFAKAIEKIGAVRVAAFKLKMAGDPLVTKDRGEIKKMPMMVLPIADGWFVKTHSNTYTKIQFLKRIAELLGITMRFETFVREGIETVSKRKHRGRPRKTERERRDRDGFQIGRVVKWYFPMLFRNNAVTDEEIADFLSDGSKRKFGTRGYPVLKESTGAADECIVNGNRRYYSDVRLTHNGRTYLLTSQFITANSEAILKWIEGKGYSRSEITRVGRGESTVPSLFDNLTLFASDESALANGSRSNSENSVAGASVSGKEISDGTKAFDLVRMPDGGILASTVKKSLNDEMKRLMYTRRSLAAGLHIPSKVVKRWCKGIGIISAEQYDALCKHMAINGLRQREKRG